MNTIIAVANVYASNGAATLDSDGGKNPLIVAAHTPVETEVAEKLGLTALFEQHNQRAVDAAHALGDPFALLEASKTAPEADAGTLEQIASSSAEKDAVPANTPTTEGQLPLTETIEGEIGGRRVILTPDPSNPSQGTGHFVNAATTENETTHTEQEQK